MTVAANLDICTVSRSFYTLIFARQKININTRLIVRLTIVAECSATLNLKHVLNVGENLKLPEYMILQTTELNFGRLV